MSRTRGRESRCSSTRRRPISSGRSGRASGASDAQVTAFGRPPPGWASSTNRPRSSSQSLAISAGVAEGRPSACSESDQKVLTRTSQRSGPPASRIREASKPRRRLWWTRKGKPIRPTDRRPQTSSNFGEASRPDSSGWMIQSSPSPSRSRLRASHSTWAAIRGSAAGSPTAIRHAQASSGGWIVSVCKGAARGDVVEGQAPEGDRPVPEDRVADEAVVALRGEQALELGPGAVGVEAAPDDRREAGVPVPLPGVPGRARPGVGKVRLTAIALEPAAAQDPLGDLDDGSRHLDG